MAADRELARSRQERALEQDLAEARRLGRWLSDEEQSERAEQLRQQAELLDRQRLHRRKLMVFTALCVLIPPLWPVAIGLAVHLLFPRTARRLGLVAGGCLLGIGLLLGGLITALVVAVLIALF